MRIPAALPVPTSLILLLAGFASVVADDEQRFRFWQSDSFREVLDVSVRGDRLEQQEMADADSLIVLKSRIHAHDDQDDVLQSLRVPADFTNADAFRVSDNGHVVGTATRPVGSSEGNQRGFVLKLRQDVGELLAPPPSYRGSTASDITADGSTVCGLVIGRNPPRVQPALWHQREGKWICKLLPIDVIYNPFLVTGRVAISDDGQRVVATIMTKSELDLTKTIRNRLCQWKRQADGGWSRRVLSDHAVHVADVNDNGMVVGRITRRGRRRGYIFSPERGPHILEPFPGDHNAEATAVNNRDIVVGVSDDPPGPEGGTEAFVWQRGTMTRIDFPGDEIFSSARTILDDGRVGGWLLRRVSSNPEQLQAGAFLLRLDLNTDEAKSSVR